MGCPTEVYTAGSDGNLWKRILSGSSFQWHNMGRPHQLHQPSKFVHTVRVANSKKTGIRVFVATKKDEICRYWSFNTFSCYGSPSGSGYTPLAHIEMSKPIFVGSGCHRLSSGWYIALNSWDPVYHRRGRMYTLRMAALIQYIPEDNVSGSYAKVDAPLFFKSGTCPKIFSVNSNGAVWERL